ncbi:MAG: hypothetical protein AB7E42_09065 [Anaerotignaceae bacterium]
MNIFLVIVLSVIMFMVFKFFMVVLEMFLSKFYKVENKSDVKFSLVLSIVFLLMYSALFIMAVEFFNHRNKFNDLEWYIVYTVIGIYTILWCYFKWKSNLQSIPVLNDNNQEIALKKSLLFFLIMIFSFYYGYSQIEKIVSGKEIDMSLTIASVTIVSGIIALDRVLNQVQTLVIFYKELVRKCLHTIYKLRIKENGEH